ncbi:hypothetical protein FOQG_17864 [Fusarium oxysporum f. sp. raphani 54005]|uniref:Uncharacterized protein n=2 Tax=Fusarium oxysporum f. sp. raphani TaxID=96318 RepID=X0C3S7_FUSOX|nr:hypothetical protein FOQG_17864 [Fusarium oxysporum f. sp. raphani 54005]KAG7424914.1 hypothetical protein Forpi1262_v013741 [Fusarium oxysporum f. sp. raphani]KAH7205295.1 hypothetical protein BKA60DRAFT_526643 [Fusarium oxysporum]
MSLPTAPIVSIDLGDDFHFGPTVLEPLELAPQQDGHLINGPEHGTANPVVTTSLDVLENFKGAFSGFGFNIIFRPNSSKTPTPLHVTPPPSDIKQNILQLNLTSETQAFTKPLGDVPNRGFDDQADLILNGVPYIQTISDITEIEDKQPVIHFEPGLWMRVPKSEDMPGLDESFARMASIPHGTTINVQCFEPAVPSKGAPDIPKASITPIILANNTERRFRSQTAYLGNTFRLPQDLTPFIKAGTITQEILDDPNTVLRKANERKNIVENTTFTVSSSPEHPELGGGTSNIGFLIGADAGVNTASVASRSGNANAVKVTAQYWISKVRTQIHLDPFDGKPGTKKMVSPASLGPRDAVPKFILDFEVPTAKTVTVEYTQIQYSQNVILDFNGLSWPHVTVGTLAPTAKHRLRDVIVA